MAAVDLENQRGRVIYELHADWLTLPVVVVSFQGTERLSKAYSFDISILAPLELDLMDPGLLGRTLTLSALLDERGPRSISGVVASIEPSSHHEQGFHAYRIRLVPKFWLLKKHVTSRVFQNLTVPQIACLVLAAGGVPHRFALTRSYAVREYSVQYQESDYAFVRRILAEEGIFFYFTPPGEGELDGVAPPGGVVAGAAMGGAIGGAIGGALGGAAGGAAGAAIGALVDGLVSQNLGLQGSGEAMIFIDAPTSYPAMLGGDLVHLRAPGNAIAGGVVDVFRLKNSFAPSGVLLRDYDFTRPLLELRANAGATGTRSTTLDTAAQVANAVAGATGSAGAAGIATGVAAAGSVASVASPTLPFAPQVDEFRGDYAVPEVNSDRARVLLEQHRRAASIAGGTSSSPRMAPGYTFNLLTEGFPQLTRAYAITAVEHEGRSLYRTEGGEDVYRNRFECVPATLPYRPKRPKRKHAQVLESAKVVGPPGEEIHTDAFGRIKVQFPWDLEGRGDGLSSCWIRVIHTWAGTTWGTQFIPRVGMEVMVGFLFGDQDCPMVLGCAVNTTHPQPFPTPQSKTRSGIRTQSTPGGGGANELSFEDARRNEQIYLHAERDLDEVVEHNHTTWVRNEQRIKVDGDQSTDVRGAQFENVQGQVNRKYAKNENIQVEGDRTDVVLGASNVRVTGELQTRVGRERREVSGKTDIAYGADCLVRAKGSLTTIVGKHDAKRSYVLRVEGTGQLSSSGLMEIDSEKGITLKCGKSFLKISADKIELCSPAILTTGKDCGIRVDDGEVTVSGKGKTTIKVDELVIKTKEASLAMGSEVAVDGKRVLINSPKQAQDPVVDDAPPPTGIQLKDQNGAPLAYQRFVVRLDDGSEYSGILDGEGKSEMTLDGSGKISFPDLAKPA